MLNLKILKMITRSLRPKCKIETGCMKGFTSLKGRHLLRFWSHEDKGQGYRP